MKGFNQGSKIRERLSDWETLRAELKRSLWGRRGFAGKLAEWVNSVMAVGRKRKMEDRGQKIDECSGL